MFKYSDYENYFLTESDQFFNNYNKKELILDVSDFKNLVKAYDPEGKLRNDFAKESIY